MSTTHTWRLDMFEKVLTPHGDEGFIEMLGIYEANSPKYYVRTKERTTTTWYEEFRLKQTKVGGKK